MKAGDLVIIYCSGDSEKIGCGLYLGRGSRGSTRLKDPLLFEIWWRGRIATFDEQYWAFEVISESA